MGLIADLVESFKAGLGAAQDRWTTFGDFTESNRDRFIAVMVEVAQGTTFSGPFALLPGGSLLPEKIRALASEQLDTAEAFSKAMFELWSSILNGALENLNIDAPERLASLDLGDKDIIDSLIEVQGKQAQDRVALASLAINLVVALGNSVSILAETFSAGTVRSIAEAVQSWIWANGLGQLSSMSYQPQMDASVNPLLTRFYNSRSLSRIPDVGDLVRFQLREVYEERRREELLVGEDRGTFNAYMAQNGFSEYHSDSYWAAHWMLASVGQLNEMLWRGEIDEVEWERQVRFNDFDPSMIPRLKEIIFRPFTRVDARRMASLGVLSDLELLQAYADQGYFAPKVAREDGKLRAVFVDPPDFTIHKAQALVVWTKMFNALPVLRRRFANRWLTPDQLMVELRATGIPEDKVETLWQTMVKAEKEAGAAPEKDLTRGVIVAGWKGRLLGFLQARFLLERLGYDEAEAELILRVRSLPENIGDFADTALGQRLVGQQIIAPIFEDFEEEE